MNQPQFLHRLIALVLFIATPCLADYPLAAKVPDNALVYVGWAGAEALGPAYEGSHLKAVLSASNFADVFSQLIPQLLNKIPDPNDKARAVLIQSAAGLIWKHPTAFYVREISEPGASEPKFRSALVCDAGADSAALLELLGKIIAAGNDLSIAPASAGSLVWISSTDEHVDQITSALGDSADFKALMGRLQPSPAIALYVNAQLAVARVDALTSKDETAARIWPGVRDALGLAHFTAHASTAGFDAADWVNSSCLMASSPRTGLLGALEPAVADPALLARVPQTATLVKVSNFDGGKFLDAISAAFAVDPRGNTVYHQALGAADLFLGRNLRRQILGALGPQWLMYSTTPTNFVVINKPTDPAMASDSLVSAVYGICNTINARFSPRGQQMIKLDQKKISGVTVTTATIATFNPSLAIDKGILYFGMSPASVAEAANSPDATDVDITHRTGFADAAQRLNAPAVNGFSYVNLPATAPAVHAMFLANLKMAQAMIANYKIHLPPITLPPVDVLQANLSPSLSVNWADGDGIYSKSISPFPGSSTLGGSSDELTSVGVGALAAAVLLPATNRARETANRVKCASNERQIGQAILLYSNDNKGKFPPDLGTLVKTEDISAKVFVCPSGDNAVPEALKTPDQLADWVNAHSDYVYVGKNLSIHTSQPTDIVLYEKPSSHRGDGMEILYGDGHVDWHRMDVAKQLIQQHPAEGAAPADNGI